MKMRRLLALCAVLVVVLAHASTAASAELGTTDPAVDDAMRFRAEFGFPLTRALVEELVATGGIGGLPVTADEKENLANRADQRFRLQPAVDFIQSRGSQFGGIYFEQDSGALVAVVLTLRTTTAAALADLNALLPSDANVERRTVTYAADELRSAIAAAEAATDSATIMFDVRNNQVLVRVPPSQVSAATSALAGVPGVAIATGQDITSAACTSRYACYVPWRGGTYVASPNEACTWGFNARPTTTSANSTRYIVTAGHCALLGQNLTHNGFVVNVSGGLNRNTFDLAGSNMASDALRAVLKTDAGSRNLVYKSSISPAYAITGVSHYNTQNVGDAVCMSTVVSGYKCGTITFENFQATVIRNIDGKAKTVTHLWETSFVAASGDSGGPVIEGTFPLAFGIVTAIDPFFSNHMVYSSIDFVLADLLVRLCLDSNCS